MPDRPRLLLVDDDTVALQVLSKSLAQYARMRFARNGAEALKSIESEPPDLVLLDANMPGLSGMEVLRILRQRPDSAQLPVILMTSATDAAVEATALELGAQDFIRKPFQAQQLVDRMRALLRLAALRAATRRAGAPVVRQGARILLVDDDEAAIGVLRTTLAPIGAELLTASDGERALSLMQAEVPDLVLLDAEMPRLDGYAVCQAMQEDPVLAQVPVAFVSVHADARFEERSFAVGAADFMAKPFKPEVLRARVRKLLNLRRERSETLDAVVTQWQELGEQRVADLVAVASDAIVSVDAQGVVRLMNNAAAVLFGVSAERALGRLADAVLPGWQVLDLHHSGAISPARRRRADRPGKTIRLYQGDGQGRVVEPIVFQHGDEGSRLTTVVLRDAADRIAAELQRQTQHAAVVACAAQLALLEALAAGGGCTEDLVDLRGPWGTTPVSAPKLEEFDLVVALETAHRQVIEKVPEVTLSLSGVPRTFVVLGVQSMFVAGLIRWVGAQRDWAGGQCAVEVVFAEEGLLTLEVSRVDSHPASREPERADLARALFQMCAGGAVSLPASAGRGRHLQSMSFRLLRPLLT